MRTIAALAIVLVASVAHAELPAPWSADVPGECAASFPDRLADAKHAIVLYGAERARYAAAGAAPKMAWFYKHCRFLEPLEIAIRKLDDVNSFVCDTPKGRPKGLTPQFVMENAGEPLLGEMQDGAMRQADYTCLEADTAARRPLVLPDSLTVVEEQELLCYADERPLCVTAREQITAARAKGLK